MVQRLAHEPAREGRGRAVELAEDREAEALVEGPGLEGEGVEPHLAAAQAAGLAFGAGHHLGPEAAAADAPDEPTRSKLRAAAAVLGQGALDTGTNVLATVLAKAMGLG